MTQPVSSPPPSAGSKARPQSERAARADAAMNAYVGYLAGWFEIGRLAAGRRLNRAGLQEPLLNDG